MLLSLSRRHELLLALARGNQHTDPLLMDATNQGAMTFFMPVGRPAEPHLHIPAGHQVTATSTGFGTMRPQFVEPRPPTVQLYLCDSGTGNAASHLSAC